MNTSEDVTEDKPVKSEAYRERKARAKKSFEDERERFIDRLFTVNLGGTIALLGFFGASYARGNEIEGRLILVVFVIGLIASLIHYFAATIVTNVGFVELLRDNEDEDYKEHGEGWADTHLDMVWAIFEKMMIGSILIAVSCFIVGAVLSVTLLLFL